MAKKAAAEKTASSPKKAAKASPAKAPAKAAKGEKKEKKAKDPNAPKRGLSAYMFYSQAVREEVKKENPEAKLGDIAKIIGEKWGKLSDKDKEPYVKKADADKARYEKEKEKYNAAKGESSD